MDRMNMYLKGLDWLAAYRMSSPTAGLLTLERPGSHLLLRIQDRMPP